MPVLAAVLSVALALHVPVAGAVTIGGNPGPEHNYVCPHSDGEPAVECYFDAVQHLYTMCRNVKSIEVIEFGYEKSMEGTNGAKSESCLDKQKLNIMQPFQAALKQLKRSKPAIEALHALQESWLASMAELKWHDGESDDQYKARVAKPYDDFKERIATIRTVLVVEASPPKPALAKTKSRKAAAPSPAPAKAKSN
jgi:hypothetical protein